MNNLEKQIWKILGPKQTAALATVTAAGTPWVRYVTIESDPDFTLRFCTSYVMVFVHPYRIEYTGPGSFEPEIWQK